MLTPTHIKFQFLPCSLISKSALVSNFLITSIFYFMATVAYFSEDTFPTGKKIFFLGRLFSPWFFQFVPCLSQ